MCFIAGLDLGQVQDYTALAIVEATDEERPTLLVRHLQRWPLRTAYTEIAREIESMFKRSELADSELVVDHTGVGRGVVDSLRERTRFENLQAVTITAGDTVNRDGNNWRVPKRDLVGAVQVLLEQGRLKCAPALSQATVLESELANFKVKIDPQTAHDSYLAWREGAHDDLVLSVALACWHAAQPMRQFRWA